MTPLFKKLNLKSETTDILVLNAPASFEPELQTLTGINLHRTLSDVRALDFSLAFVTKQKELDAVSQRIAKKARGDAVVWFAYPKGTSKKYACEFNRDTGWDVLRAAGFDTVRAVSIDADWTALRFRRQEFTKRGKP